MPASSRIVVPELPASSGSDGERSRPEPRPSKVTAPVRSTISTPSRRRHARVERQSAPGAYVMISEDPSARAANNAYRCEMDLSPGTRRRPLICRAGVIVAAVGGAILRDLTRLSRRAGGWLARLLRQGKPAVAPLARRRADKA